MNYPRLLALLSSVAFLAACGGGGGGTANDPVTPVDPTPIVTANYTGKWSGTYNGVTFYYDVVQTGNNIILTNITPGLPVGQKSIGTITGTSAVVTQNDFANTSSATLNFINATTIIATQNSCTANTGYICLVANNIQITFISGATLPITPVDPGSGSVSYAGTYKCSFNGTDTGTFIFVLSTPTGIVSNCTGSSSMNPQFLCTGQINATGYTTTAFASTGAVAVGQASATGLTGTWANSGGAGGNISCTRN